MRLFVAVDLPGEVINEISRVQALVKKSDLCSGTYVAEKGKHITLSFLGDVADGQVPVIENTLSSVHVPPMVAKLGHVDVFKSGQRISVIYISLVCPELVTLAQKIDKALVPWFAAEARPFVPHLTLLRVKSVSNRGQLLEMLNALQVSDLSFPIDSFVLKSSVLSAEGPEYRDIRRYSLEK